MMKSFLSLFGCVVLSAQIFCGQTVPSSQLKDGSADQPTEGRLSRWLDLNALSFSMRYRDYADTDGFKLFNFGQQKTLAEGKVKLDAAGKYSVNFTVSSGRYFGWSYSDVAGGSYADRISPSIAHYPEYRADEVAEARAEDPKGSDFVFNHLASNGWGLSMRRLYFAATPVKQLSFEYGSLGIERGAGSEITTYDDDGYVAGERLRVRDPHHLFLDEVVVTYGYLGDFFTPNFFSRGDRLAQSNYHQFLAKKKIGSRATASVDYTRDKGTHTWREAALVAVPESRFLDSVRVELYQRTNETTFQDFTFDTGRGYGITAGKKLRKALLVEGGFDSIDHDYTVYAGSQALDAVNIALNGDAYGTGRRVFARTNYKANPYISFFGFYTHTVNTFWNSGKQGLTAGLTVDFKKAVTQHLN